MPFTGPSLFGGQQGGGVEKFDTSSSSDFDARAFRRALNRDKKYNRKVLDDQEAVDLMDVHGVGYSARGLVAQLRDDGFVTTVDGATVKLAEAYGFCWGVERAVQMAYEARNAYPGRQIHITNEIIHNPTVNDRLDEMGVMFIEAGEDGEKDFSAVGEGHVVILPAFGASVHEMKLLQDRGTFIVDTTCPWVSKVWSAVEMQTRKDLTSIIHGKYAHEETIATASFAGDYIVVKNPDEAQIVIDYILGAEGALSREGFLERFGRAISPGFDPDVHLLAVGMANQTTMLKGETEFIGKMFEKCMLKKYGPTELKKHFNVVDTICDATQVRQDAMYKLVEADPPPDIIFVVGGFNSSNTSHLQEIAEEYNITSYWVDSHERIDLETGKIEHLMASHEMRTTEAGWAPEGPITVGVTSGASTPDRAVEDVLDKLFKIRNPSFAGVAERDCKPVEKPKSNY